MPVRPAPSPNRLIGFRAWLNSHAGYPALVLPVRQMFADEIFNDFFAAQIVFCHGTELIVKLFPLRLWTHPVHGIKALLKDVVRARFEVAFFPGPKLIAG